MKPKKNQSRELDADAEAPSPHPEEQVQPPGTPPKRPARKSTRKSKAKSKEIEASNDQGKIKGHPESASRKSVKPKRKNPGNPPKAIHDKPPSSKTGPARSPKPGPDVEVDSGGTVDAVTPVRGAKPLPAPVSNAGPSIRESAPWGTALETPERGGKQTAPQGTAIGTPGRGDSTASVPVFYGRREERVARRESGSQRVASAAEGWKKRTSETFDDNDEREQPPLKIHSGLRRGAGAIARPVPPVSENFLNSTPSSVFDIASLRQESPSDHRTPGHPQDRNPSGVTSGAQPTPDTRNVTDLVQTVQKSMETLMTKVLSRMKSVEERLEKCESSTEMILKFMASTLSTKPKESTIRIAAALAPLQSIYSGVFQMRMFGMVFILTFTSELKVAQGTLSRV